MHPLYPTNSNELSYAPESSLPLPFSVSKTLRTMHTTSSTIEPIAKMPPIQVMRFDSHGIPAVASISAWKMSKMKLMIAPPATMDYPSIFASAFSPKMLAMRSFACASISGVM